MMRPVTVHVNSAAPDPPVLTFARGSVILNWTDGTPVNYADPTHVGQSEERDRIPHRAGSRHERCHRSLRANCNGHREQHHVHRPPG